MKTWWSPSWNRNSYTIKAALRRDAIAASDLSMKASVVFADNGHLCCYGQQHESSSHSEILRRSFRALILRDRVVGIAQAGSR